MGTHELPLVIFTVLAQCAIGAYWVCALTVLSGRAGHKTRALEKAMLVIWLFLGIGFLCSSLHLGSPFRALNTFSKVGSVSMSQEALFGVLFLGFGGVAWLCALFNTAAGVRKLLYVVGLVCSIAFLWVMISIYYGMATVPTWHNWTTPIGFIATTLMGGMVLGIFILKLAQVDYPTAPVANRLPMVIAFLALILAIAATVGMMSLLPEINSSIKSAADLIPNMGTLQVWRFIALVLGLGLIICMQAMRSNSICMAFVGLCLVVVGELIGRNIFYGLHMTVGLL